MNLRRHACVSCLQSTPAGSGADVRNRGSNYSCNFASDAVVRSEGFAWAYPIRIIACPASSADSAVNVTQPYRGRIKYGP